MDVNHFWVNKTCFVVVFKYHEARRIELYSDFWVVEHKMLRTTALKGLSRQPKMELLPLRLKEFIVIASQNKSSMICHTCEEKKAEIVMTYKAKG